MPAAKPHASAARRPRWQGCLIVLGGAVLAVVLIVVVVALVLFWRFRSLRDEFADTSLEAVPVAEADAATARRLNRTAEQLERAVKEGRTERFEFTEEQLNQMIATLPAAQEARGKAQVRIVDDRLKVRTGLPLDQVPGFQGRFLNGEFTLDLRLENGALDLRVVDAEVRGKPLPPAIMARLRDYNLADQALRNPDVRRHLEGLRGLRLEGGRLIVETGR